jgi:hypothetical protein
MEKWQIDRLIDNQIKIISEVLELKNKILNLEKRLNIFEKESKITINPNVTQEEIDKACLT